MLVNIMQWVATYLYGLVCPHGQHRTAICYTDIVIININEKTTQSWTHTNKSGKF